MQIYANIHAIAIGSFDGIHLGHQALIRHLGNSGALLVAGRKHSSITPYKDKVKYSKHQVINLDFEEIRGLDDEGFVAFLKRYFPKLDKIVVGYDFCFGKDRKYNAFNLKKLFANTVIVDEVLHRGISVHSGYIRKLISAGDVERVREFLGRYYGFEADVVRGNGIGAKELYPTINMTNTTHILPRHGVYASYTVIGETKHPSVSFVGHRESVDGSFAMEAHILDEIDVVVGDRVELYFVKYIRTNQYFETLQNLKIQITKDISQAKTILENI